PTRARCSDACRSTDSINSSPRRRTSRSTNRCGAVIRRLDTLSTDAAIPASRRGRCGAPAVTTRTAPARGSCCGSAPPAPARCASGVTPSEVEERMSLRVSLTLVFVVALTTGTDRGTVTAADKKKPASAAALVWPLPPDQPRIRYVTAYHGLTDF